MKAPPLPGVMICCFSTVQRLPSCSITCPARIRFACCFIGLVHPVELEKVRASRPGNRRGQGCGRRAVRYNAPTMTQFTIARIQTYVLSAPTEHPVVASFGAI